MYKRKITQEIKILAKNFRVITVVGPRQAGKTTLCRNAFPDYRYVSLEDPDTRLYAMEDPRAFLNEYRRYIIFDEIQRVPQLLSYIQAIVDEDQLNAQFILTGSHQLELSGAISQSLAGRTALLTLLPLSFEEIAQQNQGFEHWLLQGFMPGKHDRGIDASRFYRAYFQTYIERDVRLLVKLKDFVKFENFVRLCAGRIGQLLNQASLANDLGVAPSTISEWLSVLEASFIVFRLHPYHENFGKRLIKSSKLYFVDTGLAVWLLGIETEAQIRRDPQKGNLFENLVVVEALKAHLNRGKDPRLYFFRDSRGNEVDLIVQQGRQLAPFEIKSSMTWHSSFTKGLSYFHKLTGEKSVKGTVVYTGKEARKATDYNLLPFHDIAGLGSR